MLTVTIGDGPVSTAQNFVPATVAQGGSVVLTNVAGSPLNYFLNGIDGAPTSLTATNNVTLTQTCMMQSTGVTTLSLVGGFY